MSHSKSFYKSDYLYHHGILGQRWGKRNGPPYPLDSEDHSASEKKAGWKKSLDGRQKKDYNRDISIGDNTSSKKKRGPTDKQKRAIKIGAAVAVTALAAYGTYRLAKSGKLDKLAEMGKNKVDELLGKKNELLSGGIDGIKKLPKPENLSDTLKNTNPLRGSSSAANNCTLCGIAAFLRRKGYDVTAKGTGGEMQNLTVIAEKCFKSPKIIEGTAVKFGRSRQDAAEMLIKRFGENAEGVCAVKIKGSSGGHAFNWIIKNGVVSFFDAQNGWEDSFVSQIIWQKIDPQGHLHIARLDDAEIDFEAIGQFVNL